MLYLPVRASKSYLLYELFVTKFEKASKNMKVLLCIDDSIMLSTTCRTSFCETLFILFLIINEPPSSLDDFFYPAMPTPLYVLKAFFLLTEWTRIPEPEPWPGRRVAGSVSTQA